MVTNTDPGVLTEDVSDSSIGQRHHPPLEGVSELGRHSEVLGAVVDSIEGQRPLLRACQGLSGQERNEELRGPKTAPGCG